MKIYSLKSQEINFCLKNSKTRYHKGYIFFLCTKTFKLSRSPQFAFLIKKGLRGAISRNKQKRRLKSIFRGFCKKVPELLSFSNIRIMIMEIKIFKGSYADLKRIVEDQLSFILKLYGWNLK